MGDFSSNINTYLKCITKEGFDLQQYIVIDEEVQALDDESKNEIVSKLHETLDNETVDTQKIGLYSTILRISPSPEHVFDFLGFLLGDNALSWEVLNSCHQQLNRVAFLHPQLDIPEIKEKLQLLQYKAFRLCGDILDYDLTPIPSSTLNPNITLILTEQYITELHSPTKVALNLASSIKNKLKKDVLIFNTAECGTPVGCEHWVMPFIGNYNGNLNNESSVSFNGNTFTYFQCPQMMPDLTLIKSLLDAIKKIKPSEIICIGGAQSIFMGFADKLIPTITSSLSSDYTSYLGSFRIILPNFYKKNETLLNKLNIDKDSLITTTATYELNEQTTTVTREMFNIPEEAFVLATIGNRLDTDITEDLLNTLEKTLPDNTFILFVGKFPNYDDIANINPGIYEHSAFIGYQNDMQAILEICDLYINPVRQGGGTTGVYALYKGVPVITTDYGDIASVVGEHFICDSLDDYPELIHKYYTDINFYIEQVQNAKTRAAELLEESPDETKRVLSEYDKLIRARQ